MKNYFCLTAIFCLILNIAHPMQSSDCDQKPCERPINLDDASKKRLLVYMAQLILQNNNFSSGVEGLKLEGIYKIGAPGDLEQYKVCFDTYSYRSAIKDGQPVPPQKVGYTQISLSAQLLERIGVTIPK